MRYEMRYMYFRLDISVRDSNMTDCDKAGFNGGSVVGYLLYRLCPCKECRSHRAMFSSGPHDQPFNCHVRGHVHGSSVSKFSS